MDKRRLGSTGREVGVIGLGGAGLGNVYGAISDEEAQATVSRALALGIDFIDTAPLYGNSEERLGAALAGRREQVFLATKVGVLPGRAGRVTDYDGVLRSVEDSLRRLGTDHFDLLQYHELQPANADQVLADDGALGAMRKLRDEGVATWLGVTGRNLETLCRALRTGEFVSALTYMEYSPLTLAAQEQLFPLAEELNIGLIAGSPLAAGMLTGGSFEHLAARRGDDAMRRAQAVYELAAETGYPVPTLALAFELADPRVTVIIPGANSAEQVAENVAAAAVRLPDEIVERLRRIAVS